MIWIWVTRFVSGAFLAATGGLLFGTWNIRNVSISFSRDAVEELAVKGALIIAGYSLLLLVHFVVSALGLP